MRRSAWLLVLAAASAAGVAARPAAAVPVLRVQVDQRGDILWIGNTSAQECAATARVPVVGTIGNCGNQTADSAPDIFWQSDSPVDGQAAANNTITAANARSTAVLLDGVGGLPSGATITYARLYWGAQLGTNTPDQLVTLDLPDGTTTLVTADTSYSVPHPNTANVYWYESTADVTSVVTGLFNPTGSYRLSGIDSTNLINFNSENPFVGWSLVFFYQDPADPTTRNLALFDGLDLVSSGVPASATLSGFLVPNAGFDAKLGVMAYEGDIVYTGDSLIFNGNSLADAVNPVDNFFNASRSWLGAPVSVAGDLPQMDGLPASMSGIDIDVLDVTTFVAAGQMSATIQATSSGDTYMIGAFATSISTYRPDFSTTTKTYVDLNGGGIFRGDVLEYTIVARNSGNDTALNVILTDPLPGSIVYVPGSIQVTTGANVGVKTDAAGDDQGEYDAGTRTITVRLGTGANTATGGTMAPGESTTITFRATVNTDGPAIIANQGIITASGQRGNPTTGYPTGNGSTPGTPTDTPVDECLVNGDCPVLRPFCYTLPNPNICVVCINDSHCGATDSGRVCVTPGAQTCIDGCRGMGGNGCPAGRQCTSTTTDIGYCLLPDGGLPPGADAGFDAGIDVSDGAGGTTGIDGSIDGIGGAAGAGPDGSFDGTGGAAGASGAGGTDGGGATDGGGGAAGSAGASGRGGGDGAAGRGGAAGASGAAGTDGGGGAAGDDGGGDSGGAAGSSGAGGSAGEGGSGGSGGSAGDTGGGGSGATPLPGGTIEGGGCACTTPGAAGSSPFGATTLLAALTGLAAARRRRRRR